MKIEDYETYEQDGSKKSKSKVKEIINKYIEINNKLKNESAAELNVIKREIKKEYQKEIFFTMADEIGKPVKFNITEKTKKYFIPIFTDINEYDNGYEKISKLFLDKLDLKVMSPEYIRSIADEDENFKGVIINPHSQNFSIDLKNL